MLRLHMHPSAILQDRRDVGGLGSERLPARNRFGTLAIIGAITCHLLRRLVAHATVTADASGRLLR
jgi:hypothetical protein